ncbi:hypothetical protein NDU88_005469 [Pleurodeles waltl]|uniref:Uncharacterized protein n=1 Tax=Pleurodeles waltl TaxID=8319 RepID=A0AAV7MWU3_PLEWA|nr:hypothetical protein NDU88_005469 [Pleurodeles waltl]
MPAAEPGSQEPGGRTVLKPATLQRAWPHQYPLGTIWSKEGPEEPSGDRFPDPEVLLTSPDRTDEDAAAGLFKSPHSQGRQHRMEEEDESGSPDDGVAQENDHCQLLNWGARNQEDAPR